MRYLYFFLLSVFSMSALSQQQPTSICFILYVKGDIKKPSGQKLTQGDTILFNDLAGLKFDGTGAMVNLYEATAGSFRMTDKEIIVSKKNDGFFVFLTHLLKIKGHPVSLSSRGECRCVTPQSCFIPDTNLNDKVLLIDQLSFRADDIIQKAESAAYYLNYNGQKRMLKIADGSVLVQTTDFMFRDTSFTEGETPELIIGLYVKNESGTHNDLVAKVKFNIIRDTVLAQYYKALRQATGETDLLKIKQSFVNDVYLYFGKPSECEIDKIINSIKE